ncbi:MAG: AzlD domain-containing protein [Schaedlerella sp.]|nr:AzlD domain-containing protein [Lachnospiraceae bacterium]MDY4202330.1 AzlD domain-containing protein [Schaedlerella sp.]
MSNNIYIYILVMAAVTYCIRLLPLTLIRKEIKNKYIRSFLYYVPYVTLAAMTFPAILTATANIWSAAVGFIAALILAYNRKSLITVSLVSCICVFLTELITGL